MTLVIANDPISSLIDRLPYCPKEDRQQLSDLFQRFPKVFAGYQEFVEVPPFQRIAYAAQKLEITPRNGWLRFDLELEFRDVLSTHASSYFGERLLVLEKTTAFESVLAHSVEAQELFLFVYQDYKFKQWGAEVMKFHDFVEAINGDFTPLDKITKSEKRFLELVALHLLTDSRNQGDLLAQHVFHAMRIFEGDVTRMSDLQREMFGAIRLQADSQQIKPQQVNFVAFLMNIYSQEELNLVDLQVKARDIDCLQMLIAGRRILHHDLYQVPYEVAQKEWGAFIQYIDSKLVTEEAKLYCKIFKDYFFSTEDEKNIFLDVYSAYSFYSTSSDNS